MAKVGENAVNMGAVLGLTPERFQTISDAMGIVGLTGDALTQTFRRLSSAAETAQDNPISKQASAFKSIELDAKSFATTLREDPEKSIDILAEKFKEFGESGVSGPFGVILGRSSGAILKFLKEGEEGIAKLKEIVKEAGSPSNDVLTGLDQLDDKFNLFSQSARNLKIAIVDNLNQPLGQLLDILTKVNSEWTKFLNRKKGREEWESWDEWGNNIIRQVPGGDSLLQLFGATPAQPPDGATHTSASENFAHFNYGNIKARGGGWREFDSPEAGVAGIEDWLRHSQRDHDTDTLAKIIERYAPKSDNAGKDLIGDAVRRTGLKPNEKLDMENVDQLHAVTAAILSQEGAPKAAFDALKNIGGSGNYNIGTPVEGRKVAHDIHLAEDKKAMDEEIKNIKNREKEELASLAVEEAKNHDDLNMRAQLARQKVAIEEKAFNDIEAAKNKYDPVVGKTVDNSRAEAIRAQAGVINAERAAQQDKDDIALKGLETSRKIADEQERSQLQSVERLRTSDQLTISQALSKELQIVDDHKQAVERILADELRLTEGRDKLHQQVVDRARELEQKMNDERRAIAEKAQAEEIKRGHDVDKEIARTVSGGIVDLAWGKSTPGQAIASTAQDLEKRALDSVLTKALDASGIGSLLDKAFQSTIGSLFSKGVDTAVGAPVQAAANATALAPVLGTALTAQVAAQAAAITTPIVAAITGSAAVSSGVSAVGSTASAAGGFFSFLKFLPFFEQGGIVPSAAGGWQVPNVGSGSILAQLHSNEMVLPSGISAFIQSAAAGGGRANPVHFAYSPTINAPETPNMKQLLSRHGNDMLSWMQSQFRSGALKVPA